MVWYKEKLIEQHVIAFWNAMYQHFSILYIYIYIIYIYMQIYIYIYIYIYAIMKTMCTPSYHHHGFVATPALEHELLNLMEIQWVFSNFTCFVLVTSIDPAVYSGVNDCVKF